jgi:trehalose 6-phosphate phosphatase
MDSTLTDKIADIAALADDTTIAVDFDGTLSPIVSDPTAACAAPGALEALETLAGRFQTVAVISGRPLAFLEDRIGADRGVTLIGLYGLEVNDHGIRHGHPEAELWRPVVAEAVKAAAAQGWDGCVVEDKGLSLTIHYRNNISQAPAIAVWANEVAEMLALEARDAKMSVELHPPIHADKGTVIDDLTEGRRGPIVFAGDDLGDLPAFHKLADLAAAGRRTLSVAVVAAETPQQVADAADVAVPDQAGVVAVLAALADAAR